MVNPQQGEFNATRGGTTVTFAPKRGNRTRSTKTVRGNRHKVVSFLKALLKRDRVYTLLDFPFKLLEKLRQSLLKRSSNDLGITFLWFAFTGTCNLCFADGGKLAENLDICNKIQTVHTCSTNEFLNLGSTHCYTAALKYKLEYMSPFFSSRPRTLIVRGCANCTGIVLKAKKRYLDRLSGALNDCFL